MTRAGTSYVPTSARTSREQYLHFAVFTASTAGPTHARQLERTAAADQVSREIRQVHKPRLQFLGESAAGSQLASSWRRLQFLGLDGSPFRVGGGNDQERSHQAFVAFYGHYTMRRL